MVAKILSFLAKLIGRYSTKEVLFNLWIIWSFLQNLIYLNSKKWKKWEMKIILAVWQFTQSSTEKDTTLYFLQILFRFDRACRSNHNFWQGKVHFWPVVTDSKQIRKFPSSHLLFYRFTQSLDCLASDGLRTNEIDHFLGRDKVFLVKYGHY